MFEKCGEWRLISVDVTVAGPDAVSPFGSMTALVGGIASGELELSDADNGVGTVGNASRIESPVELTSVVADVRVCGKYSGSGRSDVVAEATAGSSAMIGCATGVGGGGPEGGGRGGSKAASVSFLLPLNQDARLCLGLPDAVELLRFLSPPSNSAAGGVLA